MTEETILEKVRNLLSKAESTEFPEEAKAFTEGAQKLMAKYAIDEAMVSAAKGSRSVSDKPSHEEMVVKKPYANAKTTLLYSVARNNDVKVIMSGGTRGTAGQRVHLFGFETDLKNVRQLYTSLLLQSTWAMLDADQHKPDWEHGKTFRNSFLMAFANEIGIRLRRARQEAKQEAAVQYGDNNLLPVLASRHDQVEKAVSEVFPRLTSRTTSLSNWSATGAQHGRSAAQNASVNKSVGGSRPGLGR